MPALDHIGLSVANLDEQAAWYASALGLTPRPRTAIAALGVRGQYLVAQDDGWALELLERDGSRATHRAASPSDALLTRGYAHLCLRVPDVDRTYERLLAAGALAIAPPTVSPMSGLWIAFVADPEGNLIELIKRPAEPGAVW